MYSSIIPCYFYFACKDCCLF